MNVKIGTIIKKLRAENNITQDTLATAIGVTPQAISRWESESGYPDIELLPMLADFFSVSIDELLGYKLSQRAEEIINIKKEISRLAEIATLEERITFARNAISRYPTDFEIKENLAVCLYHLWCDTRNPDLFKEIENLCSSVVTDCKEDNIRYGAITVLVSIYAATKQPEKAIQTANLLTPMKYCREFMKSSGLGDGNTELYIQDEIDKLTDCLGCAISNYALNNDLPNDPFTWDRKIKMLTISNQLYKIIYGDNLMFYHVRLSQNYWLISTYLKSQGKIEDCLASLEKACHHAIEYDKAYLGDHGKSYTSIFTDKLIYPKPDKDFHELTEHTQCYRTLEKLQHKRYDSIRQEPRFISIIEKLKQYAK